MSKEVDKTYNYTTAITAIVYSSMLEDILKNFKIPENYHDDLLQEIYLILLQYSQEKIEQIFNNGDMKFFLVKIVKNQYFSRNSPFYSKYKKFNQLRDENISINHSEEVEGYNE